MLDSPEESVMSLASARASKPSKPAQICFNRTELMAILNIYGRMVAAGEWRDYAIDTLKDRAIFSVFRRTSEMPLYRIEKDPKLARRQGAYSLVSQHGQILKRGHELSSILNLLNQKLLKAVES